MDNKYIEACEIIRRSVSSVDAGKLLGLSPGRDGRCKCPFHGGYHRNLKLYGAGRGYYCFVCHACGDVISLVKECNQCNFYDAVEWINANFNLRLNLRSDSPWSRFRRAEQARAKPTGRTV